MSGRDFDIVTRKKERNMDGQDQVTGEVIATLFVYYLTIFLAFFESYDYFLNWSLCLFHYSKSLQLLQHPTNYKKASETKSVDFN